MKNKKLVFGIFILIIFVIGITTALYKWSSGQNTNINVTLNGYDAYVDYEKGDDNLDKDLAISDDYLGGDYTTITLGKNDNALSIPLYGHIYISVNEIDSSISNGHFLKWVLTSGSSSNVVAAGEFNGYSNSNQYLIYSNFELTNPSTEYTLWVYLLGSEITSDDIAFDSIDFDIKVEVTGKSV